MMETAFKLRSDAVAGTASPVLFLDFDDRTIGTGGAYFAPPPPTTPRALIARLLDFVRTSPAASTPRVALLDIDIGQSGAAGRYRRRGAQRRADEVGEHVNGAAADHRA